MHRVAHQRLRAGDRLASGRQGHDQIALAGQTGQPNHPGAGRRNDQAGGGVRQDVRLDGCCGEPGRPVGGVEVADGEQAVDAALVGGRDEVAGAVDGKRTWFQAVPLLESNIVGTPQISIDENGTVVPLQQGPEIAVIPPLNGAKGS